MGTFRVNHPAWTVAFWDDAAARKFVYARYPRYADVYSQLKRPVMRADMLRYMLMDAYGGVYADVDVESVQPLERLLDVGGIAGTASCVVSPEPRAHGAILEASRTERWCRMPSSRASQDTRYGVWHCR